MVQLLGRRVYPPYSKVKVAWVGETRRRREFSTKEGAGRTSALVELHSWRRVEEDWGCRLQKDRYGWVLVWLNQQSWKRIGAETRWGGQVGANFHFLLSFYASSLFPWQACLPHPFSFNIATEAVPMSLRVFLINFVGWDLFRSQRRCRDSPPLTRFVSSGVVSSYIAVSTCQI